jgi:hypothetical protein
MYDPKHHAWGGRPIADVLADPWVPKPQRLDQVRPVECSGCGKKLEVPFHAEYLLCRCGELTVLS